MKERIEPLIAERAPWLAAPGAFPRALRHLLDYVLGYDEVLRLAHALAPESASAIMNRMALRLAKKVHVSGLDNIPASGPALIVANHPTGIGDGIMLWHALSQRRPDAFFYANADILRVLPQLHDIIAPVEWRLEKRTHAKTRETMRYTREAFDAGRPGILFPSGRLAKRRGLRLHERPWMTSAATLARKFDLPVVPVHIDARNSALFYLFDIVHPTLRDITLFHETLNKDRQDFRITIGTPLSPDMLPADAQAATRMLRHATLSAGASDRHRLPAWTAYPARWPRGGLPRRTES